MIHVIPLSHKNKIPTNQLNEGIRPEDLPRMSYSLLLDVMQYGMRLTTMNPDDILNVVDTNFKHNEKIAAQHAEIEATGNRYVRFLRGKYNSDIIWGRRIQKM
jgi:hypothetical protein